MADASGGGGDAGAVDAMRLTLAQGQLTPGRIAVANAHVYWIGAETGDAATPVIWRVPKDGGTVEEFSTPGTGPVDIAAAQTNVGWTNSACGGVVLATESGTSSPLVGNNNCSAFRLTVFGNVGFWTSNATDAGGGTGPGVWSANFDGTALRPVTAYAGTNFVVAVDATHVYVEDNTKNQLMQGLKSGGETTALTTVDGDIQGMTMSAGVLYWATSSGTVTKLNIASDAGSPEPSHRTKRVRRASRSAEPVCTGSTARTVASGAVRKRAGRVTK